MMYCGNPAANTIGVTQNIENLQVLHQSPSQLSLLTMKVPMMDVIIVAPALDATLMMVTTRLLIMITETRIIMPNLETNQGPVLMACKTLTMITAIILMMTNGNGDKTAISPSILAQARNAQRPSHQPNLLQLKCLPHLVH